MAWATLPKKHGAVRGGTRAASAKETSFPTGPKPTKYRSRKVEVDRMEFDSKKEADRYMELSMMEKAGLIRDLDIQVRYVLIPEQRDEKGKLLERECCYYADFQYTDTKTGNTVVEDTKGFRTPEYRLKRKLMLYVHGIRIKEL